MLLFQPTFPLTGSGACVAKLAADVAAPSWESHHPKQNLSSKTIAELNIRAARLHAPGGWGGGGRSRPRLELRGASDWKLLPSSPPPSSGFLLRRRDTVQALHVNRYEKRRRVAATHSHARLAQDGMTPFSLCHTAGHSHNKTGTVPTQPLAQREGGR